MYSRNISILGLLFVSLSLQLPNGYTEPVLHYGRCFANNETGYCKPRQQCWERNVDFSNNRNRCPSQVRADLVCCRAEVTVSRMSNPLKVGLPQPGVCGAFSNSLAGRIISGSLSDIGEYPWMALLLYSSDGVEFRHLCGGSLIHERWVLTAAHCVPSQDQGEQLMQVRLGEWNTTSSPDCQIFRTDKVCAPPHIDIPIDRVIVHELYAATLAENYANDIALLRLNRSIPFTKYIQPICLPAGNSMEEYAYAGYAMEIAGWGKTEEMRSDGTPVKLKAVLQAMSIASCRSIYAQIVAGQLCAGGDTPASTCHGDSGGPLMLLDDLGTGRSSYYLAGIISLGSMSCNNRGKPMIFTRIEHYIPWVMGTITSNS